MRRYLHLAFLALCSLTAQAERHAIADSLVYHAEFQTTLAAGDHAPLWLNANRYGLSSLSTASGYLRGSVERPLALDSCRKWGVGYGADVAVAAGFTSTLVVQQAYVEARWLRGVLTVGARQQPVELKNQELSTGSQTLGINARPVPQVRLSLPDYWTIPGTRQWLALKGHIAFGKTTDDRWQREFTQRQHRYTEGTLYHSKAGYVRVGRQSVTFEAGLEMASQFGGKAWRRGDGGQMQLVENSNGLKAFWNALVPGGSDPTDGNFLNVEGNMVGSWVARLTVDRPSWLLALYADHFFEDHSMLFHYSKSGDGYFLYDFSDWLLGAELRLHRTPWLQAVVVEHLYSKYQGGPVYHDHTPHVDVQISGRDNYYNHHLFTGWQHWGQVMGNPLYVSPLYNDDGTIEVRHNRLNAWHLGVSGQPLRQLRYRLLLTWQQSVGTYYAVPLSPLENTSLLAEATWLLGRGGWQLRGAVGFDTGRLRGDNLGVQLTVGKSGWWTKGRK